MAGQQIRIRTLRLPRWSLKGKFIATLAIFTVVLSVSFGLIAVQRLKADLKDQLLSRGEYIAGDLINKFWGPGSNDPESIYEQVLKAYNQANLLSSYGRDVLYVQVVKNDPNNSRNMVLKGSDWVKALGLEQELRPPVRESSNHGVTPEGVPYIDLIKRPSGKLTPAVSSNYVRIGLSLAAVEEQVQKEFLIMSALTALFIIVGLALAFWLYKSILGPVETLTRSVKRFKRDMHVRAHVATGDELQTLSEEFNRMADTIQERDERLERINEELRKANRVKSEFLAVMGHELKTPLHAIRGYAQLLLEGIDGPITLEQREDLDNIVKSGDHLRALIDNVLQFSKLEAGEETLHPAAVEVGRLIAEALQNVKVLAREKGIEVRAEVDGLQVYADETKLKQVLINLLSNALKCTHRGRVAVSVRRREGEVVFTVEDTGIGIPEAYRERIFDPFTQIDSSTTRPWAGIGLGLSIVRRYVEMHGGRVWVESEEGVGSAFHFTIPDHGARGNGGGEA